MDTQARLEQLNKDLVSAREHVICLEQNQKELTAELEKSKLRHLDIGTNNRQSWIRIGKNTVWLSGQGDDIEISSFSDEHFLNTSCVPKVGNLQDYFDDIEALQEDVVKFAMTVDNTVSTSGEVKIGQATDPNNLVWISIKNNIRPPFTSTIHLTEKEFEIFTMKCKQKVATLKRKNAENK